MKTDQPLNKPGNSFLTFEVRKLNQPQILEDAIMKTAIQTVKQFLVEEDGPTAVEYAVLLGLIIVGAIALISTLGQSVQGVFTDAETEMTTAGL